MFNETKDELNKRPCFALSSTTDWQRWGGLYPYLTPTEQKLFINIVKAHTGIPYEVIEEILQSRQDQSSIAFLDRVHLYEHEASSAIKHFQEKPFFRQLDVTNLHISRSEWLAIINKYTSKQRFNINTLFLLGTLSMIRRVTFESLQLLIQKEPLPRVVKRPLEQNEEHESPKPYKRFYRENDTHNPLVADLTKIEPIVRTQLESKGVRFAKLKDATPEKCYESLMKSPGGSKFRPVYTTGIMDITLFKRITPEKSRVDVRNAQRESILKHIPTLDYKRAETVRFIATLEAVIDRKGKRRTENPSKSAKATAADVFRAHGIEIQYEEQKKHHWAHLVAHFLCDASELDCDSQEDEIVNYVPSTAPANYNTLQVIELFIRESLLNKVTEEIAIEVEPEYSGDSLIPDRLIYTLEWTTKLNDSLVQHHDKVYVNPQSYERVNQRMLESIKVLREWNSQTTEDETNTDDEDSDQSSQITPP